jgi:hypothetical protein
MRIRSFVKKFLFPCKENNYFPLVLRKKSLDLLFILLLFLKIFTLPLIFSFSKSLFFAEITRNTLVELLNSERIKRGLSPLSENQKLIQSAYLKAKDILEKDYFSHWNPEGLSPWYWFKVSGYNYQFAGENLAIGFLESSEVHKAWMNSPTHRQNILNPNYTEVGIAVLKGEFNGNEVYVVVQHFGKPKEVSFAKTETLPKKTTPPSTPTVETEKITISGTETIATSQATVSVKEKVLSQEKETSTILIVQGEPSFFQKTSFFLTKFFATKYTQTLNLIIYSTLAILILSLTLSIYCDIFVYRKFIIDYKELIPRWIGFCLILLIFLYLDQSKIVQLIPHQLQIYGF